MDQGTCEIVFILDRSGSMAGLEGQTIKGFRDFLKEQGAIGKTHVTVILFDDQYELIYQDRPIESASLSESQYYVRGMTAMLDAIGQTITEVSYRHQHSINCPDHTIVVITTDGMENASRHYSYAQIRDMIGWQQEKDGWQFVFLGANLDVKKEADQLGIRREHAVEYNATDEGIEAMYTVASDMNSQIRMKKN